MKSTLQEEIGSETEIFTRLKELSKDGKAWTFSVLPFSHTVRFYSAVSPSKFPDTLIESSGNRIGWKGEIVPFTKAALLREQNRGVSRD